MFHLAVLFWYVVVACHVARHARHFRWLRKGGRGATGSQRLEEADPLKEKYCQKNKEKQKHFPVLVIPTLPEGAKPQQAACCLLS